MKNVTSIAYILVKCLAFSSANLCAQIQNHLNTREAFQMQQMTGCIPYT